MSSKVASKLLVRTGRLQRPITGPRRFRKIKPDLQVKNWKIVRGDNVRMLMVRLSKIKPFPSESLCTVSKIFCNVEFSMEVVNIFTTQL